MAPEDIDECFATAQELVREAGKIVMEGFRSIKTVSKKADITDVVTVYDTKVEEFLFDHLKEKYPSHKFIGEESSYGADAKPTLSNAPTWIIDPIDGTLNFIHNVPLVAISVALAVDRQTVVGIVYNPVMDEMFTAVANKGAFRNSEAIKVSNNTELSNSMMNVARYLQTASKSPRFNVDYGLIKHMAQMSHGYLFLNCCTVEMCYIAAGIVDALYIDHPGIKCWDIAACSLLIKEAGGLLLDPTGGQFDMMSGRVLCACTQELAEVLLKEIDNYVRTKHSIDGTCI